MDFHLPTPKGARDERPLFRLLTCLGDKFIFRGRVSIYQNIVVAGVTSKTDSLGNLSISQQSFIISVYYISFNILNWWKLKG